MSLTRRRFLGGLAIALAAPTIVRASSLMAHVPARVGLTDPYWWPPPYHPLEPLNSASLEQAIIEIQKYKEDVRDMMMISPNRLLGLSLPVGDGVALRSIPHPRTLHATAD